MLKTLNMRSAKNADSDVFYLSSPGAVAGIYVHVRIYMYIHCPVCFACVYAHLMILPETVVNPSRRAEINHPKRG